MNCQGARKGDISDCAKVENFRDVAYFCVNSRNKNVLLKYKGDERLEPRRGSSIQRVGFLNWIQGKRFAAGLLDYSTNVGAVRKAFSIITSSTSKSTTSKNDAGSI